MKTKGRDLPAWLLWVSIDYTTVSRVSGATRAEHSHVLWCLLKGVISGLIPASAMPFPQKVHFSLCCAFQHAHLCTELGFLRAPAWCSQILTAVIWTGSWTSQFLCSGFLRGTDWLTPKMVRQYLSSRAFARAFIHVIILAVPTSAKARCWLPPLTSEMWSVTMALSAHHWLGPWSRRSKTLLWNASPCQIHDVAYTVAFCIKLAPSKSRQRCLINIQHRCPCDVLME